MMKYRVQVEREFSPVPQVTANPGQVQQVLLNLLVTSVVSYVGQFESAPPAFATVDRLAIHCFSSCNGSVPPTC